MSDQHRPPGLTDLIDFLDASPSPWHAVDSTVDRLVGFRRMEETDAWVDVPTNGFAVRGGAIVAWKMPTTSVPAHAPFRLVGAHTDSPCLRVKPNPDAGGYGWKQVAVEVYGGILNNSWLDRDLGVAGRVVAADGSTSLVNVREPIARVPQLAVHLDRDVNVDGTRARHPAAPVTGLGYRDLDRRRVRRLDRQRRRARRAAGVVGAVSLRRPGRDAPRCRPFDAGIGPTRQPAVLLGGGAGARSMPIPLDHVAVIVLNDHEEVGSSSATGAAGPFLQSVLSRLVDARGGTDDDLQRSFAASSCVSADNAHAVHPNYPERHEPGHRPIVNAGPAIKVNSNQRYATSATTAAEFQRACERAGVPWQVFVSRNNMPCGSTIGPITSTRLGIATVDVGVPQLSMHSARELCGAADPLHLRDALVEFLAR